MDADGQEAEIRVLGSWEEIGDAVRVLRRGSLPLHSTPEKNWDLGLVEATARSFPMDAKIIDLGGAGLFALRVLSAMGFHDLVGVDFALGRADRVRQLKDTVRVAR